MKPISFFCVEKSSSSPAAIATQILDLEKWRDFKGYGPLPAIKSAEFEVRTSEVVGTRIRVMNGDGSKHVEEIVCWRPDERIELRFSDFSPPLSRMADSFLEIWEFEREGDMTLVKRSMLLYPKSIASKAALWMISFLLKGAIARHLKQLAG